LARTLLLTQLLPLCIGLGVRGWRPRLAARLKKPADRLVTVLNLIVVGLILALHFRLLTEIRPLGFAGMLALLLASLTAGSIASGPESGRRKALAFTTAGRNAGVSLVIAAASFPGTSAVTAVLAHALIQTIVLALVALGWGRWASAGAVPPRGARS